MVVECRGDPLFSCELHISQFKSKILFLSGPWRHEPSHFFFPFHPCNFPKGQALRLPPSLKSVAYFKQKHWRWVKMTSGSLVFSRYHGHRSLFSLKSPLEQKGKKRNFDLKEKSLVPETHACFYTLFFTHKRKPVFFLMRWSATTALSIALNTSITVWCDSMKRTTFSKSRCIYTTLWSSKWFSHVLNGLMAHVQQPELVGSELTLCLMYHH